MFGILRLWLPRGIQHHTSRQINTSRDRAKRSCGPAQPFVLQRGPIVHKPRLGGVRDGRHGRDRWSAGGDQYSPARVEIADRVSASLMDRDCTPRRERSFTDRRDDGRKHPTASARQRRGRPAPDDASVTRARIDHRQREGHLGLWRRGRVRASKDQALVRDHDRAILGESLHREKVVGIGAELEAPPARWPRTDLAEFPKVRRTQFPRSTFGTASSQSGTLLRNTHDHSCRPGRPSIPRS